MSEAVRLRHGSVELALHRLCEPGGDGGRPLLVLHALGERTPEAPPPACASWPGPVYGLDFTGHGASTVPRGGGYTAEMLMGDVDVALAHLGPSTLLGRGLGAYVALLIAGSRPPLVRGAVLADGPGLAGGGATPPSPHLATVDPAAPVPPDPWALVELTRDPRPPDYATTFVRQATNLSDLESPITVSAVGRPAWLDAVVAEPGVRVAPLPDALAGYA